VPELLTGARRRSDNRDGTYDPRVPEPPQLPRATEAVVPSEKLARYALDPAHPRGQHKARVFASALGIGAADWAYLRDQILESVPTAPVKATRITPFGVAYEIVIDVEGLNGATAPVVTTWIVQGGEPPRLTSTWVDVP
jgi:hypothetical protein